VTVICIALREEEFEPVLQALARQTFQDYEFVGVTGGAIPEAWNQAIRQARGELLVFTETDARPVNEHWLEELVNSVPDDVTIVKGLEITGSPLDLSNLAARRRIFEGVQFDERFRWAEDTELFCRLKQQGYRFQQVDCAPVIHRSKTGSKHYMRRAFRYGLYWARLSYRYPDPVELAGFSLVVKNLLAATLNLFGLLTGYLIYWPERRRR
jgi:GT2 family glycosyltransferase